MTPAQLVAIKNDIAAAVDLNVFPNNDDGNDAIARLYNIIAVPNQFVWRTDTPVKDIFDAIDWSKYTPVDVADGTAIYTNRLLAIQTKQMNLQTMLFGRTSIDASKPNIRAGLRDAVIALPAGVNGNLVVSGGASGVTVLNACTRLCTRIEKLLLLNNNTQTGTVAAGIMGFEGAVTAADINAARNS
jgi:hypothetical protein